MAFRNPAPSTLFAQQQEAMRFDEFITDLYSQTQSFLSRTELRLAGVGDLKNFVKINLFYSRIGIEYCPTMLLAFLAKECSPQIQVQSDISKGMPTLIAQENSQITEKVDYRKLSLKYHDLLTSYENSIRQCEEIFNRLSEETGNQLIMSISNLARVTSPDDKDVASLTIRLQFSNPSIDEATLETLLEKEQISRLNTSSNTNKLLTILFVLAGDELNKLKNFATHLLEHIAQASSAPSQKS